MIGEREIAEALGAYVRDPHEWALEHAGVDPIGAHRAALDYARMAFPEEGENTVVYAAGVLAGLVAGCSLCDAQNAREGAPGAS